MNNESFLYPFTAYPNGMIINVPQSKAYSYQAFYGLVTAMAGDLEQLHLAKHSVIVIYGYKNSFKALLLFFACIKCGYIPFIVEAASMAKITDLKFNGVFSDETLTGGQFETATRTTIGGEQFYYNIHPEVYIGDENDLLIVSSSGSTSKVPKKILLGKTQTITNIRSNQEALSITEKDVTLLLLPVSYSYGLIAQFLSHFFSGATIVLGERLLSVLQLPELLVKYRVTNVFMTPLLARLILYYNQHTKQIGNSLRFITLGGDKPQAQTLRKIYALFACPIYGTYGLAEAGPRVATYKFMELLSEQEEWCIGDINPGISVEVQREKKYEEMYQGINIGYLSIRSPSIYLGYIKGNKLKKTPSPQVLRTKDICIEKGKRFYLLGREDDFIIYKGKIIWFYKLSRDLYETPGILKITIRKNAGDVLEIKIFHRNVISITGIQDVLNKKYDLKYGVNYHIKLMEFNNTHYK
ncbi:AMP-binding protein [Chitinophaga vietnamensis]|uniref:AMP-binding protein n=1 Tax=Chitinophaga vietnamensis TaxID=2593957 RepID=UPI00117798F8|nr:class I adenylate-forming enzyme family protein [Chitinophaga vietnamensis]